VAEARQRLFSYLVAKEGDFYTKPPQIHPLKLATKKECILVLKNIIMRHNERRTGTSSLFHLWSLIRNNYSPEQMGVSRGFIEEFKHLFLGVEGRAEIYSEDQEPDFHRKSGREASRMRSDYLDSFAESLIKKINRYPTGLDPEVQERRRRNRRSIMDFFGASDEDWSDWRWHLRHTVRDEAGLGSLIKLSQAEREGIRAAMKANIPFAITPYYVSLMDPDPSRRFDHAVRAQVIPDKGSIEFLVNHIKDPSFSMDFMRERDTSPIDLVTRRYPMIAIIKPSNSCFQICQYCQRNWEIMGLEDDVATATPTNLKQAIEWFRDHKSITEVLITGGDPLILPDDKIEYLLSQFSDMPHIERIRIGTRTLAVLPQRITPRLLKILDKFHRPGKRETCIVTHFEHAYEVTPEVQEVVRKIRRLGLSIYNQMVFTIENSRRFEAVATRRALKSIGIEPYYTFNTKGKEETRHFRVPIARLLQELKEEVRPLPGTLRLDQPVFNIPLLGKNYLQAGQHHELIMIKPNGQRIYEFHPWEKNIKLCDTYLYEDVPIYDYLQELKRRGENLKQYRTIWYYY